MSTFNEPTPDKGETPEPKLAKSNGELYQEESVRLRRGEDGNLTAEQFLEIVDEADHEDSTTFNWSKMGKFRQPKPPFGRRFPVCQSTLGHSITDRTVRDHSTMPDGSSCATGMLPPTSVASVDLSSSTSRD